jgi:hypothetical protein
MCRSRVFSSAFGLGSFVVPLVTSWVNVKNYGAAGNGIADDTSAITAAVAAVTAAGRGVLYFPAGKYVTSGGFTISAPTLILGDGMGSWDQDDYITQITCTSGTASLFTVSAQYAEVTGLSLRNTYAGAPSAGAAVTSSPSTGLERVDIEGVSISGFYDNLDLQGTGWAVRGCWIYGPVRYGILIRNTVIPDAGDWSISDSGFFAGIRHSSAGIRMESSGGGKVVNCKFNRALDLKMFAYGIEIHQEASTSILLVANCSFENTSSSGIYQSATGWSHKTIVGCQFGMYQTTDPAIDIAAAMTNVVVSGCILYGSGTNAISLTDVTTARLVGNINQGYTNLYAQSGSSGIVNSANA